MILVRVMRPGEKDDVGEDVRLTTCDAFDRVFSPHVGVVRECLSQAIQNRRVSLVVQIYTRILKHFAV